MTEISEFFNSLLEGGYANPDFSNISQEMHTAAQKEL
jgi:hypothetical protein